MVLLCPQRAPATTDPCPTPKLAAGPDSLNVIGNRCPKFSIFDKLDRVSYWYIRFLPYGETRYGTTLCDLGIGRNGLYGYGFPSLCLGSALRRVCVSRLNMSGL